uniref:(northern house mosquito) hypothetical protein n=1 Tax=Culex pipiens TaxID=7175 RepID=A0A8D8F3W1_CULPI
MPPKSLDRGPPLPIHFQSSLRPQSTEPGSSCPSGKYHPACRWHPLPHCPTLASALPEWSHPIHQHPYSATSQPFRRCLPPGSTLQSPFRTSASCSIYSRPCWTRPGPAQYCPATPHCYCSAPKPSVAAACYHFH